MATRSPRKTTAKPAVSPAQIIEDGPMIGHVLEEAAPAEVEAPAAEPAEAPAAAPTAPFANDLATLEAEPARDELIRQAAHRRYLARGMTVGDPVQDWLEAEAEVDAAGKPAA